MNRAGWPSWLLLIVWSAWLLALQGLVADRTALGAWLPDLGIVLLAILSGRLPSVDLPKAGLAVGLARCALTVDAPVAVLAGLLGAALCIQAVGAVIDLRSPILRAVLAGLLAAGLRAWLALVHELREVPGATGGAGLPLEVLLSSWRISLSSAFCALALDPLLARLPGLTPLIRRRAWPGAATTG